MFVREELIALAQATKRREHFGLICSLLASLSSSSACHRLRLLSCSFRLGLSARYDVVIGRDPHAIDSFHASRSWSLRKVIPYGLPIRHWRKIRQKSGPAWTISSRLGWNSFCCSTARARGFSGHCILRSTFAPLSGSTRSSARPVSM